MLHEMRQCVALLALLSTAQPINNGVPGSRVTRSDAPSHGFTALTANVYVVREPPSADQILMIPVRREGQIPGTPPFCGTAYPYTDTRPDATKKRAGAGGSVYFRPSIITNQAAGATPPGKIGWFDSVFGTRRAGCPSKPAKPQIHPPPSSPQTTREAGVRYVHSHTGQSASIETQP